MGRLIDADALIKEYPQASGLKLVIENVPTAYDVEKVMAELEETKVNTDTVESRHHNMIIDICADIVKRGGVE